MTSSGVHPASCPMGTGDPFPGVKRGRGVMLTTHPHLMLRSRMSRSYTSSPPQAPLWRVVEQLSFVRFKFITALLNNVRKVGVLVLRRTYCFLCIEGYDQVCDKQ
jgi:hypothetical protein